MALKAAILVLLVAATAAVPLPSTSRWTQCRRSCPRSSLSKYYFQEGYTYKYEYKTKSSVELSSLPSKKMDMQWTADVNLHFESPCEVTLQIESPRMDGESNAQFDEQLTKWPLKAVFIDGTFEELCVDERDSQQVLNVKKGILSAIQSSFPTNSTLNSGIEIVETDVLGVCPTTYKIEKQSGKVMVEKIKDHRRCTQRYGSLSLSEYSGFLAKSPLNWIESKSVCKQEIEDGFLKWVDCRDKNEFTMSFGLTKNKIAYQNSTLSFKKSERLSSSIKSVENIRQTDLIYVPTKAPSDRRQHEVLLSQLKGMCRIIENKVTKDSARMLTDLVTTLNRVEESFIQVALEKIQSGELCSKKEKLEDLYYDVIGSSMNGGAVRLMVKSILQNKRVIPYTWRLFTFAPVCSHAVEGVRELVSTDQVPLNVRLAAGNLVGSYCRYKGCYSTGPSVVLNLLQISQSKIRDSCKKSREPTYKELTLSHLKMIANIKNATAELQSTILDCFMEREAHISVRLQAAETLRQLSYHEKVVSKLVEIVKTEEINTEIRISAYKAAVLYSNVSQLEEIINATKKTKDMNVYSFIASDLINLQKSKAPFKLDVRHRLSRFNISDYMLPLYKNVSGSYEKSYFTETGVLGGEISSEYIYKENDFIPRQFRTNVTVDLLRQIINLFEVGGRIENLPGLLKTAIKQNSLLSDSHMGKMIKSIIEKMPESSGTPEIEMFIKSMGKELLYFGSTDLDMVERDLLTKLADKIVSYLMDIMMRDSFDSVYTYHHKLELHVSTIQGIPLVLSHDLSVVAEMNVTHGSSSEVREIRIEPTLAVEMTNYFGYKFMSAIGLQMNSTLYTDAKPDIVLTLSRGSSSLKLNTPFTETDIVQLKNHFELRKEVPGKQPYILQDSPRDPRRIINACSSEVEGVQFCSRINMPVLYEDTPSDYPLVKPVTMNITIVKKNPSMQGFIFSLDRRSSGFDINFSVPGTHIPKKFELSTDLRQTEKTKELDISTEIMGNKRVVKVQTRVERERGYEFFVDIFYGKPDIHQVFHSYLMGSPREFKLEAKTLGPLQQSLHLDLEVELAYDRERQVSPIKDVMGYFHVNKFEFVVSMPYWVRLESYLRHETKSSRLVHYESKVLLMVMDERLLLANSRSDVKLEHDGFEMDNLFSVTVRDKLTKGDLYVTWTPEKKRLIFDLEDAAQAQLLELVLSQDISTSNHKRILSIDIPYFGVDVRLSSHVKPQTETENYFDVILMWKSEEVMSVRGPYSTSISDQSVKHKSEIGIRVGKSNSVSTYHLKTDLDMDKSEKKYYSKVILTKEHQVLMSIYEDVRLSDQSTSLDSKIDVPSIIFSEVKLALTPRSLQTTAVLVPKTFSNRTLEGQLSMSLSPSSEGQYSAKLFWDKSKDLQKNIEFSGRYIAAYNQPTLRVTIRGDAIYNREKYHYEISKYLKNYPTLFDKLITIDIMHNNAQMLKWHQMMSIEHADWVIKKVSSELSIVTPYSREISIKKLIDISRPSVAEVKYDLLLNCPKTGRKLDGSIDLLASIRHMENIIIDLKSSVENIPSRSTEPSLKMKSNGYIDISMEGYLNDLLIDSNITSSGRNFEMKLSESARTQQTELSLKKDQQIVVRGLLKREGLKALDAEIDLPSKSFSVSGKYDHREKFVRISTNKQRPSEKIELRFDEEYSHERRHVKLSLEYPHGTIQKSVVAKMSVERGELVGQLSLDVSPSSSDVLSIVLKSKKVETGLYRVETGISSKKSSSGPMIIIDVGYQRNLLLVESVYKPESTARPIVLFSTKHVKVSPLGGSMSFKVNSNGKKMELGGYLSYQNDYNCQGYKLNSTIESLEGKRYGVEILTCSPMFVKVITYNKQQSWEKYILKAGLQSYSHAELSFVKNSKRESSELWKKLSGNVEEPTELPIAALSTKLVSPYTLSLRSQFNSTNWILAMEIVETRMSEIISATEQVLRYASQQLVSDIKKVCPELSIIVDAIAKFFSDIMSHEKVRMVVDYCCDCMTSIASIIDDFINYVKEQFKKIKAVIESFMDDIMRRVKVMWQKIYSIIDAILEKIRNLFGLPSSTSEVFEIIKERVERSIVVQKIKSYLEETCKKLGPKCEYVKYLIRHIKSPLKKYFLDIYKFTLNSKSMRYVRSVVRRTVDMVDRKEYMNLFQLGIMTISKQNVGVLVEPERLQVNLPLRKPVSNVLLAMKYIGYTPYDYKYFTLEGQRITTYQNSIFKLPRSNCEYILSRDRWGSSPTVTYKRAGHNDFTIKFQYKSYVSLVVPTKRITLNGRPQYGDFRTELIPHYFEVVRTGTKMVSTTPALQWVSNIKDQLNTFRVLRDLKYEGIAWLSFYENLNESQILEVIEPYKVDKNCRP